MPSTHPLITVQNVSFSYQGNPVLEDISLTITKGDYVGIIGPNGGGKTTLLKIILGLLKSNTGTVTIEGQDIHSMKNRWKLGYVPQRSSQNIVHFPATVEEIVATGRTARQGLLHHSTQKDIDKITWAMEVTNVIGFRKQLVTQLSGGERQRVFIARALAGEPEILLLDEPTVAIDVASSQKFYAFLGELNRNLHLTILFVSHDIDCVAREVSSVICLNRRLVCQGKPQDFLKEEYLEKLYGKKIKFIYHGH